MELVSGLASGFSTVFTATNMLFLLGGAVLGLVVGTLPGISPVAATALILPLLFSLSPVAGMIAMAATALGAAFGRAITAMRLAGIELAAPQGVTDPLKSVAWASAAGAIAAAIMAVVLITSISEISLLFGPAEYAALMLAVLLVGAAMASESPFRAIAAIALGLLLSMVGTDIETGKPRLTLGLPELTDGINLVILALGLFVVGDVIRALAAPEFGWPATRAESATPLGLPRAILLGLLTGILPGSGTSLTFPANDRGETPADPLDPASHASLEQISNAAAASGARLTASFLPMLGLGIPTNAVAALLVAGFFTYGIPPGPQVMIKQPELFWAICAAIVLVPVLLLAIVLTTGHHIAAVSQADYRTVAPVILAVACVMAYAVNASAFDVFAMALFGALGYLFTRSDCERGLLVIAFTMGGLLEENIRRAMLIARGDISHILSRPIVAATLVAAIVLFAVARWWNQKATAQ